jgi:hypothetical protein
VVVGFAVHGDYIRKIAEHVVSKGGEGIVVRIEDEFPYSDFRRVVAKYVRKGHVQTHGHWMRQRIVPNRLQRNS